MKHCYLSYLLAFFIISLLVAPVYSATSEVDKCINCHDNMYNKALHNNYVHQSFLDKKCLVCHVSGNTPYSSGRERKSSRLKKVKINWLQKHYEPARTHFFLIPESKTDGTLFVKIKGKGNRAKITSLALPPLEKLPQRVNDRLSPEVFDIKFLGVKRGILYSATISWKTDEPSDAQVRYGLGDFNLKTRLDPQLKTSHLLDLSPLVPGKIYNYTVVSKDIHGNRTISQPLTFSTEKTGKITPTENVGQTYSSFAKKKLEYRALAVGDRYFLTIKASRSTYMNIGSNRDLQQQITMPAKKGEKAPSVKHVAMMDSTETNVASCLSCHTDYQSEVSHPINVRPKRGMTFPDDYPRFADGRMHCMTCHEPHASNNVARIRRPTKQALCIGCHQDYG